jgi:steroid 5-alpha reductase family enzyme
MNASIWIWICSGLLLASVAYCLARYFKIYALVDLVWSLGILFGTWAFFLTDGLSGVRAHLVLSIASLWALRLSLHLLKDRIIPRHEDPRYSNLIERWGDAAPRNFSLLFFAQVPLVAIFLLPIKIALGNPQPVGLFDILAVWIAFIALGGESLADRQLAAFRNNPQNAGKVCSSGLWRYSRHPNYFFEWILWWAYVMHSIGTSEWIWSLLGPVVMYIFLRYLTGIPPAEYSSLKRRGAAYAHYQTTTSPFFPWKPKIKNASPD